jgi:hypothetical protein
VLVLHGRDFQFGHVRFLVHVLAHGSRSCRHLDRLVHQPHQQRGDLGDRQTVVHRHVVAGVAGHARVKGLGRILHHRQPAQALDGHEPRGAVVQRPGQDHADHAAA